MTQRTEEVLKAKNGQIQYIVHNKVSSDVIFKDFKHMLNTYIFFVYLF